MLNHFIFYLYEANFLMKDLLHPKGTFYNPIEGDV